MLLELFSVALHFIFISNDLESHKKETYINPIGFIRELKQSQTIQAIFERTKHYSARV